MSDKVTLLWTGGWDSTFRLLQLLLVEKRSVQPIYVIDFSRYSRYRELETMTTIAGMVRKQLDPDVTFYPTKIYLRSDFPDIPEIRDRFEALRARFHVPKQYHWLALIAEYQNWHSVEISMERHYETAAFKEVIFNDIEGENPTLNSSWEAELFKYWSFPLITTQKYQMRQIAEENGFIDILSKRWFCARPVRGKCCGMCRPCELAVSEGSTGGIDFIHPLETLARKQLRKLKKALRST